MTTQLTSTPPAAGNGKTARRRPDGSYVAQVGRPGFAWALPATFFFAVFAIAPLIMVAVLSFMSWNGLGSPQWVGMDNWSRVLDDPVMIKSIWLTLLVTVLGVAVQTPLSILLGRMAQGGPSRPGRRA
ncbi:carbohydrate ABC transporter permease, partial [Streptomyces nodosus]